MGSNRVTIGSELPAGTQNIGDVDVLSLPAVTGTVTANAGTNLNTSALATSAQVGEVQANPTANTVLDRLKAIGLVLPGFGTAGTPSANVVSVQGVASGTVLPAGGDVASGSADAGNPVKVGGRYNTTPPTFTNGQRGDLQLTARGALSVAAILGSTAFTGADGLLNTNAGRFTDTAGAAAYLTTYPTVFNGTSWDRERSNVSAVLLASGARTTTQTSADLVNYNHSRLTLIVDMTTVGTGSITPSLQVKDANGVYVTIWTAAAAIATNGTRVYSFVPGVATGGTFTEALPMGIPARTFRIVLTANNANSATYSAAYEMGL